MAEALAQRVVIGDDDIVLAVYYDTVTHKGTRVTADNNGARVSCDIAVYAPDQTVQVTRGIPAGSNSWNFTPGQANKLTFPGTHIAVWGTW